MVNRTWDRGGAAHDYRFLHAEFREPESEGGVVLEKRQLPEFVYDLGYKTVKKQIDRVNPDCRAFPLFYSFRGYF